MMKIYVMVKTKYILPIGMNNTTVLWEQCEVTHVSTWKEIHSRHHVRRMQQLLNSQWVGWSGGGGVKTF